MQGHLSLIPHQVQGEIIYQRPADGYINATAMCKAAGKKWNDYFRLSTTTPFISELSSVAGIPATELIQSISGGFPQLQGTWVHPQVASNLAQWLSPKFAVMVSGWIVEWMSAGARPATPTIPAFIRRMSLNWDRVDPGYFSVINELTGRLYGRLELAGHVLADRAPDGTENRPDVSVGKTFPPWLAKKYPSVSADFTYYLHTTPEWEGGVKQYPNSILHLYIEFVDTVWIPEYAEPYLRKRDPAALQYLPKLLPSANRPKPGMGRVPTAKTTFKRSA